MDANLANLLAVARQSAVTLLDLLPYVAAGAALGALFMRRRRAFQLERFSRLPPAALILLSSVLGTLSPLCTVGTVPMVIGLINCGLPAAAAVAFLTASSLVNPQIAIIAAGTIGSPLAFAQWGCGLGIGSAAGLIAHLLEKRGIRVARVPLEKQDPPREEHPRRQRRFLSLFLDQLERVLIYVVMGVVGASAVNVYMPGGAVRRIFLGADAMASLTGVAAGALTSVPLYVCGGGVLPLLAELMRQGLPPGVVLAFIVAGPATRFQALAAVAALLRKGALLAYILLVWLCAFTAGALVNWMMG
jgi:hypothetical protein